MAKAIAGDAVDIDDVRWIEWVGVQCSSGTDQDNKRQTAYNTTRHDHLLLSLQFPLISRTAAQRQGRKVGKIHGMSCRLIGMKKPMNVTRFPNRSVKIRPRNASVSIPFRFACAAASLTGWREKVLRRRVHEERRAGCHRAPRGISANDAQLRLMRRASRCVSALATRCFGFGWRICLIRAARGGE